MKPPRAATLGRNALFLAGIISFVNLTDYLLGQFYLLHKVRLAIRYLFPDEVFNRLRTVLLNPLPYSVHALRFFPLFTVLLSILLVIGARRLRQQQKTRLLMGCYYALIVSTVTAIPDLVSFYHNTFDRYTQYQSQQHPTTGILGLIDAFERTEKPSLPLFILQGLILVAYAAWSGWQIWLLSQLRKQQPKAAAAMQ